MALYTFLDYIFIGGWRPSPEATMISCMQTPRKWRTRLPHLLTWAKNRRLREALWASASAATVFIMCQSYGLSVPPSTADGAWEYNFLEPGLLTEVNNFLEYWNKIITSQLARQSAQEKERGRERAVVSCILRRVWDVHLGIRTRFSSNGFNYHVDIHLSAEYH